MFANLLRITLVSSGGGRSVPRAWLEQFFLRDFTGHSAFDETLVAGEGLLEAGNSVDPEIVHAQLEKWLRGRKMIPADECLLVEKIRG
jgi:hypothetical protein